MRRLGAPQVVSVSWLKSRSPESTYSLKSWGNCRGGEPYQPLKLQLEIRLPGSHPCCAITASAANKRPKKTSRASAARRRVRTLGAGMAAVYPKAYRVSKGDLINWNLASFPHPLCDARHPSCF